MAKRSGTNYVDTVNRLLKGAALAVGALLVVFGVWSWAALGEIVPLVIAAAVVIAGPLESWLSGLRLGGMSSSEVADLADQVTSLGFLMLLFFAALFAI